MKPLEILAALPQWAKSSPAELLTSPAWAMPCRLGEQNCTMRLDAPQPAETLDLIVKFGDEEHLLGLCDSENLQELHAVWSSRADMPEPILLALVEKDCGPLFQMLENSIRRQLGIVGIAKSPSGTDTPLLAQVRSADGAPIVSFTLSSSPAIAETLGQLRFIDVNHPSVRDAVLPATVEYASFALPAADLSSLAPGDALLLPEIGTMQPRQIVSGLFAIGEKDVSGWKDDGMLRVVAAEQVSTTAGTLVDVATGGDAPALPQPPPNTPLRLVRFGKAVATGRLETVGDQKAFVVDTAGA